jgi:hypothetical protein
MCPGAVFLVLLVSPFSIQASEHGPAYDFVELGWSWLDAAHQGNGVAGNASFSISDHAFLYGNASFVDFGHGAGEADSLRLGAGFHAQLNDRWDWVARAAAQHLGEGGHASYGLQYEGGLKGKFTPHIEAWAMLGRSNWHYEHFPDQTFARLGVLYEFNHHWGVTADTVLGKHEKEYFVAASYLF